MSVFDKVDREIEEKAEQAARVEKENMSVFNRARGYISNAMDNPSSCLSGELGMSITRLPTTLLFFSLSICEMDSNHANQSFSTGMIWGWMDLGFIFLSIVCIMVETIPDVKVGYDVIIILRVHAKCGYSWSVTNIFQSKVSVNGSWEQKLSFILETITVSFFTLGRF